MNTTIDHDDEETVFQSSHREWAEDQERRQQERDEQAVQQFLRSKLIADHPQFSCGLPINKTSQSPESAVIPE